MNNKRQVGLKNSNGRRHWNSRGQFFLIAALVIVVIIIGLGTISISTKVSDEDVRIFDLTNEIDLEGRSVVDHGVFQGEDLDCLLYGIEGEEGCTEDGLFLYYAEANPDQDITIVYGDPEGGHVIIESIEVGTGGWDMVGAGDEYGNIEIVVTSGTGDTAKVEIAPGESLTFDLKETGQSWFVVVVDEEELTDERTVATNEWGD